MTKRNIDILLLARPDHSLNIYYSLSKQKELSFHFLTFRVLNHFWHFLKLNKVSYVGENVSILKLLTLRHILKYKFHKFVNLDEAKYFMKGVKHILNKTNPRIIHYWPSYCHNEIERYKKSHTDVITIADQYMPNPIFVMSYMKPVYERFGMKFDNTYLERYSQQILQHFKAADYIAVPSKFVEDTMKKTFPYHKYLRVPYGITKSKFYEFTTKTTQIKNFVYVGGISLEKGVDIILEYFSNNKDFELHLFGLIKESQSKIFAPYKTHKNIHFHGAVSKDQLQHAFCHMDVGIHPSRFDAYSLAVGEEIGAGLPVIVSENTGNLEDVKKYNWGIGFTLEDMSSLDSAVMEITDINRYNALRKSIHTYIIKEKLSYGEKMISCYKSILSDGLCK